MKQLIFNSEVLIKRIMENKLPNEFFVPDINKSSDMLSTFYAYKLSSLIDYKVNLKTYINKMISSLSKDMIKSQYRGTVLLLTLCAENNLLPTNTNLYMAEIEKAMKKNKTYEYDDETSLLFLKLCRQVNYVHNLTEEISLRINKINLPNQKDDKFIALCYRLLLSKYISADVVENDVTMLQDEIDSFEFIDKNSQLYCIYMLEQVKSEIPDLNFRDSKIFLQEILNSARKGCLYGLSVDNPPSLISTYYVIYILSKSDER